MTIKLTKTDFFWVLSWTLDGVRWSCKPCDSVHEALALERRIALGLYPPEVLG